MVALEQQLNCYHTYFDPQGGSSHREICFLQYRAITLSDAPMPQKNWNNLQRNHADNKINCLLELQRVNLCYLLCAPQTTLAACVHALEIWLDFCVRADMQSHQRLLSIRKV